MVWKAAASWGGGALLPAHWSRWWGGGVDAALPRLREPLAWGLADRRLFPWASPERAGLISGASEDFGLCAL